MNIYVLHNLHIDYISITKWIFGINIITIVF